MTITSFVYQTFYSIYRFLPFKKYLCWVIKICKIPNKKFYKDLRFKENFTVKLNDTKFSLFNSGFATIENELFWKGIEEGWEKVSIGIWQELSKNAKVIFDVGANTGIYSLISKTVAPNATVFAFEPSKRIFDILEKNNLTNNFDINCYTYALSNQSGTQIFYDTADKHQYSASLNKEMSIVLQNSDCTLFEYDVPTITLDDFISKERIPHIDLIKIDVELFEVEVLQGFKHYLPIFKPTILIEVLNDEIVEKIERFFDGLGYLYFSIDEISQPSQCKKMVKSGFYNFLVCQENIAKALKLI